MSALSMVSPRTGLPALNTTIFSERTGATRSAPRRWRRSYFDFRGHPDGCQHDYRSHQLQVWWLRRPDCSQVLIWSASSKPNTGIVRGFFMLESFLASRQPLTSMRRRPRLVCRPSPATLVAPAAQSSRRSQFSFCTNRTIFRKVARRY